MASLDSVSAADTLSFKNGYLNGIARRIAEIALASLLLLALAPLLCLIALAVRLTSPGPVLFRQLRHGRDMQPFWLLKFRSMRHVPPPAGVVEQASRGDLRITPLGRFLRRTSIDELPQLFNVMRGDMSLIGPRPHAIEHDHYYSDLVPGYRSRFRARPGLTGLAQVSGARGATPEVKDMARRVHFDLEYLRTAGLRTDVAILVRTIREVVSSDSAY
jgi:putative colanic acid biosysnthesis UDP-glucose lipid carrier transferase